MRISDWSSDVCSSDLQQQPHAGRGQDPDGDRQHQLHQPAPSGSIVPSAVTMVAPRGRRSDWCASAISISVVARSEEHTSELQSLMRISYAVFCLKKKNRIQNSLKHTNSNVIRQTMT